MYLLTSVQGDLVIFGPSTFTGQTAPVFFTPLGISKYSTSFCISGKILYVVNAANLRCIDAYTVSMETEIATQIGTIDTADCVTSLIGDADGYVYIGYENSTWELRSPDNQVRKIPTSASSKQMYLNHDQTVLMVITGHGFVEFWNTTVLKDTSSAVEHALIRKFRLPSSNFGQFAFNRDITLLYLFDYRRGGFIIIDAVYGVELRFVSIGNNSAMRNDQTHVVPLDHTPTLHVEDDRLIAAGDNGVIYVMSLTGQLINRYTIGMDTISAFVSVDGRAFAANYNHDVYEFLIATGEHVHISNFDSREDLMLMINDMERIGARFTFENYYITTFVNATSLF